MTQGIMFKPDMHKAIREGRKTVTRRLDHLKEINEHPDEWIYKGIIKGGHYFEIPETTTCHLLIKPRYHVGEVVYVKEAWATEKVFDNTPPCDISHDAYISFKMTPEYNKHINSLLGRWRSPLFMPAWAARYFIQILSNDPERLQEITEEDAVKEGLKADAIEIWWQGYRDWEGELLHQQATGENPPDWMIEPHKMKDMPHMRRSARDKFINLWDSINKNQMWDTNSWVWRYSFIKVDKP